MLQFFLLLILYISTYVPVFSLTVIAHRGASGYLPEHTLQSKVAAFLMNSDYIEQDVVLSKDNIPIVLHDIYLDTVTDVALQFGQSRARNDSRFYAIDFYFNEIKQLNVFERIDLKSGKPTYPNRFPLGKSAFKLSSLSEEIELIQGMQKSMMISSCCNKSIGIYIEIKQPYFHRLNNKLNFSEIVLDLLKNYGYSKENDLAIVQCFDPFELIKIRNFLKSNITLVQLLQSSKDYVSEPYINYTFWNNEEGLRNISTFAQGIGPEKDQLIQLDLNNKYIKPSDLVYHARHFNLFIHPYTFRADRLPSYVRNFNELMDIFASKIEVDGVFTDFPDMTIEYLHKSYKVNGSIKKLLSQVLTYFCFLVFLFLAE